MGTLHRTPSSVPVGCRFPKKVFEVLLFVSAGKGMRTGTKAPDIGRMKLNLEPENMKGQAVIGARNEATPRPQNSQPSRLLEEAPQPAHLRTSITQVDQHSGGLIRDVRLPPHKRGPRRKRLNRPLVGTEKSLHLPSGASAGIWPQLPPQLLPNFLGSISSVSPWVRTPLPRVTRHLNEANQRHMIPSLFSEDVKFGTLGVPGDLGILRA